MTRAVLIACIAASSGCTADAPELHPSGATSSSQSAAPTNSAAAPALIIEDDLERAFAMARLQGKLLFVDVWAPWCAPCLAFRSGTLQELDLERHAASFVFAALDTDRPGAAPFLQRHGSRALPTLLVLRPDDGSILALRSGSVSLAELQALLAEGLRASREADASRRQLIAAHAAYGEGRKREASELFQAAARDAGSPAHAEAAVAALDTLAELGDAAACAAFGRDQIGSLREYGALLALSMTLVRCADRLPPGAERDASRAAVTSALEAPAAADANGATPHDRAEGLALLAELERAAGKANEARATEARRLALLEEAASQAPTPERAQAFDHARVKLYLALARSEDAVALLRRRAQERPSSYETHGRLGTTLLELDRPKEAVAPLERAIALAYGPPRLVYLGRLAAAVAASGDSSRALVLLREEVAGWQQLSPGQRDEARLKDAQSRLAALDR